MSNVQKQAQFDQGQSLLKLSQILTRYNLDVYLDDETGYIVYHTGRPLELEAATDNLVEVSSINNAAVVLRATSLTEVVIFADGLAHSESTAADRF